MLSGVQAGGGSGVPPAFVAMQVALQAGVQVQKATMESSRAVLDLLAQGLGVGQELDVSA